MVAQRGALECTGAGAQEAGQMQPLCAHEPRTFHICPHSHPLTCTRADIFLPIHHSIMQEKNLFQSQLLPRDQLWAERDASSPKLTFQNMNCKGKSLCRNSWSLLLASQQLPLYPPSSLSVSSSSAQHHRDWEKQEVRTSKNEVMGLMHEMAKCRDIIPFF